MVAAALGAFSGIVARTAAQAGVGAVAKGVARAGITKAGRVEATGKVAEKIIGAAGNTASQGSKKSTILDSKGNPMITSAKTGVAPANTGLALEQSRENNVIQERMIALLQTIADNTSGKNTGGKDKPQQTLIESFAASIGGAVGSLKMIVAGFGLFRGFKDAAAAKDRGESEFGQFQEFLKGTIKGILNIPFNILDNILNIFDIDIPDNMGDLIVEGAISMVKDLANYIKDLPERIMKSITGMISNISIPKMKIFGMSFGPYYPFRGDGTVPQEDTPATDTPTQSKTIMPESKNKEGISNDLNLNEFKPVSPVTSSGDKATKKPFTAEDYKKLQGTTSYIKDPVTGEGMTVSKTSEQMTKEQAMEVLGSNKNRSMTDQINEEIKHIFRAGKPMPNIGDLPFMNDPDSPFIDKTERSMFRSAVFKVYPELLRKLYDSKTKDGKYAADYLADLKDPTSDASVNLPTYLDGVSAMDTSHKIAEESFNPIFSEVTEAAKRKSKMSPKNKDNSLGTTQSDSGNAIMDSSAAAENAKSKESSNVIINAPSSTVNAPKSSNMVMPENIRNNEPSMSRYIDGLNNVNI